MDEVITALEQAENASSKAETAKNKAAGDIELAEAKINQVRSVITLVLQYLNHTIVMAMKQEASLFKQFDRKKLKTHSFNQIFGILLFVIDIL